MADSDMSGVPPMIAQGQIVDAIARELIRGLPEGWVGAQFRALILAPTTEYFLFVDEPETGRRKIFSSARVKELSRELRTVMYTPGKGSWFGMDVDLDSDRTMATRFNYDDEPEFSPPGVDPVAYVADQEKFPRDEANQPEWLKQTLAEGRAKRAARGE